MEYYIAQLEKLQKSYTNVNFQTEVLSVIFLYRLYPLLDSGCYPEALSLKWNYEESLLRNISQLNPNRQSILILYTSLLNYLNGDLKSARKAIGQMIFTSSVFSNLSLFRAIRMVNLIYLYESKETDLLKVESRSLMREMHEYSSRNSIEILFVKFINTTMPITMNHRLALWNSYASQIKTIRSNKTDRLLLNVFDFISWIESKIKKKSMSQIIKDNQLQ